MQVGDLVRAFFDTSGPGGAVVVIVLISACVIYYLLTRWIIAGGKGTK